MRKTIDDYSDGPWMRWRERDLAERCIRFIQTYCRAPKGYGANKLMKLAPFQKDWLREILADDVTQAVIQLTRGQGKSTLFAGVANWATFDRSDSGDPQVPIIATKVKQAMRSIYNVACRMVEMDPELASRSKVYTNIQQPRIWVPSTNGECFPMANDPEGLQGLDPSLAIADEIGFQPQDSWDSLVLASGKRPRSLVVGFGTPGFDRDNALWRIRSAVQEGRETPGFRYREIAAPDGCPVDDRRIWRAANPALAAGYQRLEAIETALTTMPEAKFRMFHLGQWVDGTDAWLGQSGRKTWEKLYEKYDFVLGAHTWVGLDVGIKRDSTALVTAQRKPNGKLHFKCKIWFPPGEDGLDLTVVMEYLRELDRKYTLVGAGYDPRLFEVPAQYLADEGLKMIQFPQSLERMTPAFGDLFTDIKKAEFTVDNDMAFATQVLNGVPRYNERGFTLAKGQSRGKIDAAYALAICHAITNIKVKERQSLFIL